MSKTQGVANVLKQTFQEFSEDESTVLAASLAYYMVFSLPPLLFLVILLAGSLFGEEAVQGRISDEISALIGPGAAEQVETMIQHASERASGGGWGLVLGLGALAFAATGVFVQLQSALNRAWGVKPDPNQGGVKSFLSKRLVSLGMILAIVFLMLVSLVLSAIVTAAGDSILQVFPDALSATALQALNLGVSIVLFTLLFAAIYQIMPDADVAWRDVWVGAAVTALLFSIGKFAISLYLGSSNPGDMYGAAGALAVIMLWIYYASIILLLGAEFTQVWARRYGSRIRPSQGAVRVLREERTIQGSAKA